MVFVEKFKAMKPTDAGHTPPAVYDAVLSYVRSTDKNPESVSVIPSFYPSGDYKAENYPKPCIKNNQGYSIII